MTALRELPFFFECAGESLLGVVSVPAEAAEVGVLVVVGGPQYRVGSHRQFVKLARFLAARGVPCMRFDYRGMGDASGAARDFEDVSLDIGAAIDAFFKAQPGLRRVVLWGLCDGASAVCFYPAASDPRVAGSVLLNPWVHTEAGEAKVFLKHYYLQRLIDPSFWKKLLGGGVRVGQSLRSLLSIAKAARSRGAASEPAAGADHSVALPERMRRGLAVRDEEPVAIFLSGKDYVAREFEAALASSPAWQALMARGNVDVQRFPDADHTLSGAGEVDAVSAATFDWLVAKGLAPARA